MNVHDHLRGETVEVLETSARRYPADFPGWGTAPIDELGALLLPTEEGMRGVVTAVSSIGHNPWTELSVRFPDGSHGTYGIDKVRVVDLETCSWCVEEVPWTELESHEAPDGALLCDRCWADYEQMVREGSV
jgi:hypothetical protein